ncbi:hypothetical protein TYRP_023367 [Tyrophagus putrescentiae]|nr:hypothetical protein TYRP_023367 [Tyrophagus putrescentiae]
MTTSSPTAALAATVTAAAAADEEDDQHQEDDRRNDGDDDDHRGGEEGGRAEGLVQGLRKHDTPLVNSPILWSSTTTAATARATVSTTATSTTTAVATVVKITATATAQEENDEHQQNDAPNGADDEQHGPVEEGRLAEGLVQTLRGHVGETGRCAEHLVEVAASARVEGDGVIVRALEAGRRGQAVAQLEGSLAGALRQRGHLGEARLGVIGDEVLTGFRGDPPKTTFLNIGSGASAETSFKKATTSSTNSVTLLTLSLSSFSFSILFFTSLSGKTLFENSTHPGSIFNELSKSARAARARRRLIAFFTPFFRLSPPPPPPPLISSSSIDVSFPLKSHGLRATVLNHCFRTVLPLLRNATSVADAGDVSAEELQRGGRVLPEVVAVGHRAAGAHLEHLRNGGQLGLALCFNFCFGLRFYQSTFNDRLLYEAAAEAAHLKVVADLVLPKPRNFTDTFACASSDRWVLCSELCTSTEVFSCPVGSIRTFSTWTGRAYFRLVVGCCHLVFGLQVKAKMGFLKPLWLSLAKEAEPGGGNMSREVRSTPCFIISRPAHSIVSSRSANEALARLEVLCELNFESTSCWAAVTEILALATNSTLAPIFAEISCLLLLLT